MITGEDDPWVAKTLRQKRKEILSKGGAKTVAKKVQAAKAAQNGKPAKNKFKFQFNRAKGW